MKDLLDIRKDIDKIDEQIVKLYEERMKRPRMWLNTK